eukprot:g12456.t1
MGLDWSAPPGRADFPPNLLPFTVWGKDDLRMLKIRHASLGGKYALQARHFAKLLAADSSTSDHIFNAVFDTDANGLVDAFEAMCALALLSSVSVAEKVDFMHSLFDFGLDGDLSLPEVTILVRTALIACAKLDGRVQVPSTEAIEGLCRMAFDEARLDYESSLPKHLFESFVFRDAQMTAFLQLWSGSISQVAVPEGSLWEDPDFPADPSSLSLVAGIVPPGIPPAGAVRWLRPSEVARGDEAVLFVGDVPGSSPMVPGQLADQWLLSAVGILTGHPHLLRSLFLPTRQEAVGRYCVRLFKEANWTNVFVDTLVACNASGDALFCHGEERHELWSFLLEKAFAKAHGCYENLMHGETCDALRDLTGGVAEKMQWQLAAPASALASTATSTQAAPEKQGNVSLAVAGAGAAFGAGTATAGGAGAGLLRPRVAGWGILAGTAPPRGWVFEEMRNRLLEGQVLGCSRQAWIRCPWGGGGVSGDENGAGQEAADDEFLFPPSNRLMRGLCSGVSYCVLEAFERGDVRLVRLRDPWAARQPGAEPGEYLGKWGPSSAQWSARPALASELLPRTLRGMFWMEMDAFLEVFNTLYAVDLTGGAAAATGSQGAKRADPGSRALGCSSPHAGALAGSREGYCQGSWEGEGCGGRFTDGNKGWLQGTQAFLQIGPRDSCPGSAGSGSVAASVAPSSGATKGSAKKEENVAHLVITVTQEDSRYHHRDYAERQERRRSIGFLVHSHRWSADSKRDIPKLIKILQKETKHLTRPFVPRRDVSCRLALPPGQYAIVATTLEAGSAGRFWVHVKADREFTLQPSLSGAAVAGSNAGDCDIKTREAGLAVGAAYNELEEDAEGNGMTADAASLGDLLASAQALTAVKTAIEHNRNLIRVQRRHHLQEEERQQQREDERGGSRDADSRTPVHRAR